MNWPEVERIIRTQIVPGTRGILKCDGSERRAVTSNAGDRIGMQTGVNTKQSKAIRYEMIRFAFETLQANGRFDSTDFRGRFDAEYQAAPCRYSMTGGVLVEVGVARLVSGLGESTCHYVAKLAAAVKGK